MNVSKTPSYRLGYVYFFKASSADVFVAMLMGWKLYGGADISWWLVFAPWLLAAVLVFGYAVARARSVFVDPRFTPGLYAEEEK